MRMPEWSRWCCVSVLVIAAGACGRNEKARMAEAATYQYDCPNHDEAIRVPLDSGRAGFRELDELPVPGPLTKISEYHDCQRLVTGDAAYGPLVGIWASHKLGGLFQTTEPVEHSPDSLVHVAPPPVAGLRGQVVAQLLDWAEDYPALKITRGFNCLYLWPKNAAQTAWGAKMVGQATEDCAPDYPITPDGRELRVTPVSLAAGLDAADVPPVARWDWDPEHKLQYIGIQCGNRWCEVSADRFVASRGFGVNDGPTQKPVPGHPPVKPVGKHRRVWMVKGWYDEQYIAVAPATKGDLEPGKVLATIFPHGQLDELNDKSDFQVGWIPAATVRLSADVPGYEHKRNFTRGDNEIDLCENGTGNCRDEHGNTPAGCTPSAGGLWFARIKSGRGITHYVCVTRREHKNVTATARWRWLNNDETTWIRCANGCCTLS
jgi:hypothetical protein